MPFYIFAWIAAFLYGAVTIVSKLTSKYSITNPWMFNFLWSAALVLFSVPTALHYGAGLPVDWWPLILIGFFNALSWTLFTLTLFQLDVSVISPLYNLRTPLGFLLSAVFLGEILDPSKIWLVPVITVAGFFVTYDEKSKLTSFFQKGVVMALLGMVAATLSNIVTKQAIGVNGYWNVILWPNIIVLFFLLFTLPKFRLDVPKITKQHIGICLLLAAVETVGTLAANRAYAENVGVSNAIINIPISMIVAIVLSIVAPKLLEHHPVKVYAIRITAAAVMVASAIKLSV